MHSILYWSIALSGTVLAVIWVARSYLRPGTPSHSPRRDVLFALILLGTLLIWRWPPLIAPDDLNPDESQLTAGAITLLHDPVFWRSVDGTTSGPLNFYALCPLLSLKFIPGIFAARLTAVLCVWGALLLGFHMGQRILGRSTALLGMLPALSFFALTTDGDFVHYSSEHLSLLLFSAAGLLISRSISTTSPPGNRLWFWAGVFTGLLPWAKLQSAPLALALAIWAITQIYFDSTHPRRSRHQQLRSYVAGALIPAVIFFTMILSTGQWAHFYDSFILNNLLYTANPTTLSGAISKLTELTTITFSFPVFLLVGGSLLVAAIGSLIHQRMRPIPFLWISLLISAAGLAAVFVPRLGFPHYLLFLILPFTWLNCAAVHILKNVGHRVGVYFAAIVIIAGSAMSIGARATRGINLGLIEMTEPPSVIRVAAWLNMMSQPGDSLGVWGWNPRLNVETRLPQATREGNTFRQITESVQRDTYYRPRYMQDLTTSMPALFVDSVGAGQFQYYDRAIWGHETFPDLARFISEHYQLVADSLNIRIYLRRDLLPARQAGVALCHQNIEHLKEIGEIPSPLPENGLPRRFFYGKEAMHMQTPSEAFWELRGDEMAFAFSFGFDPHAYIHGDSNGAVFIVELVDDADATQVLFERLLKPRSVPEDRGLHSATVSLPTFDRGSRLCVRTLPGEYNDNAWDWAFIINPRFIRNTSKPSK